MKIKVSDYIVDFLNKNGINTLFTITGGFAMHLNDSFGMNKNYDIYYQHHEQACGYSAVGYSKANSKPAIVCTTAGCAATNAISPCLVAHQDSLPILFISGQVKSVESIRKINNDVMKLRHYAGADCDIISIVSEITKYAHELLDINELEEVLIKTVKNLTNGRRGPVWLSIPVDIQGMMIDYKDIPIIEKDIYIDTAVNNPTKIKDDLDKVYDLLAKAERPLIIAGNGIKLGNCTDKFMNFINKYKIPVVTTFHGTDLIETNHNLYCGKIGLLGDRAGNFTLQNCDLLISLGCRMAQGIVGYRSDWFAREAKIIYIDNDQNELEKTNISYVLKLNMDLNLFFDNYMAFFDSVDDIDYSNWIDKCNHWKSKWLFEIPSNLTDEHGINPYYFLKEFFHKAPENKISIGSSGSIVGEGSFQLNMQELQTIIQYKLPIKILLFNNGAYGAIQITQTNFFKNKFGVDYSSGLSFPDSEKIANAYGIKYSCVKLIENVDNIIDEFLNYSEGPIILEIFCCVQGRYPRLNAIKNEDGTFSNRPFEDMDPFMSREEFEKEMIVKIV